MVFAVQLLLGRLDRIGGVSHGSGRSEAPHAARDDFLDDRGLDLRAQAASGDRVRGDRRHHAPIASRTASAYRNALTTGASLQNSAGPSVQVPITAPRIFGNRGATASRAPLSGCGVDHR
jgi:hypothetical protein